MKEVLEAALVQASSQTGSIRSESARVQPDSVLDFICANRISDAASLAINHFGNNSEIPAICYSELYQLSFFDLTELSQETYANLLICYRDVALIKALYFRLLGQLRWIVNSCQNLG
jgi:hypothetical protein